MIQSNFLEDTTMNPEVSTNNDFTIDCNDIILREYKLEDLDALYNLT